jgi:uncharacterized small protein (TIGR04563 family)
MAKRKVTLYFHDDMLAETQREAVRQDRSISWIIQAAWKLAREEIRALPASIPGVEEAEPEGAPAPDASVPRKGDAVVRPDAEASANRKRIAR